MQLYSRGGLLASGSARVLFSNPERSRLVHYYAGAIPGYKLHPDVHDPELGSFGRLYARLRVALPCMG